MMCCRRRHSTPSDSTKWPSRGPAPRPSGEGFTSVNVQLRKRLNLYAAVRPVRSLPGVPTRYEDVDLIILRENTEGLYSGIENQVTDDAVMSMKVATARPACGSPIGPSALPRSARAKRSPSFTRPTS